MRSEHLTHNRDDRETANRTYFQNVVAAYRECEQYEPVVACNYDEFQPTKKRTPQISEYLADVALATRRVLTTPELLAAWHKLVNEEPVPRAIADRIIVRCGAMYRSRNLAPAEYFRRVRRRPGETSA